MKPAVPSFWLFFASRDRAQNERILTHTKQSAKNHLVLANQA
jgi:hypothetical protein